MELDQTGQNIAARLKILSSSGDVSLLLQHVAEMRITVRQIVLPIAVSRILFDQSLTDLDPALVLGLSAV